MKNARFTALVRPTVLRDIMGHGSVKITLEHYYNQDYERVKRVLDQTDMARDLKPDAGTPGHKARIVHIDFERGIRIG